MDGKFCILGCGYVRFSICCFILRAEVFGGLMLLAVPMIVTIQHLNNLSLNVLLLTSHW